MSLREARRLMVTSSTTVTVGEAARELGISVGVIHKWIERERLSRRGYQHQHKGEGRLGRPKVYVDIEEVRQLVYGNGVNTET